MLSENGTSSSFRTSFPRLLLERETFSSVVLLSEKFVVASEPSSSSGQVSQTVAISAVQGGNTVVVNLASIYQIHFDAKKEKRTIERIDAVFNVQALGTLVPTTAQLALESFVSNSFVGTWLQDDEEIFEMIFQSCYSPEVVAMFVSLNPLCLRYTSPRIDYRAFI